MDTVATAPADTGHVLVIERVFDAPPALVFRLWSDPARVREWWHPKDFVTPSFEMDFREGGAYRYSIRSAKNHGWAHGVYREIVPPSRIVFTFQWQSGDAAHDAETLVSVSFEAHGERTLLTFRQEPFSSSESRHSHGVGWNQVLASFESFLRARDPAAIATTP